MNRFQVPEIAPQEAGETQRLADRSLVEKLGVGRFQRLGASDRENVSTRNLSTI